MKPCRICGKDLDLHPDPYCPDVWLKALSTIPMCCTPCGEYGWRRLRLREAIQRTCFEVLSQHKPPTEKQIASMAGFTRRYAKLVCDFYHVPTQWEAELPEMILVKPQNAMKALDEFEAGVASKAGVPVVNASPIVRKLPKPQPQTQLPA